MVGDVRKGDARCHSASRNGSSGNVEDNGREWSLCFEVAASLVSYRTAFAEPNVPEQAIAQPPTSKYLMEWSLAAASGGREYTRNQVRPGVKCRTLHIHCTPLPRLSGCRSSKSQAPRGFCRTRGLTAESEIRRSSCFQPPYAASQAGNDMEARVH